MALVFCDSFDDGLSASHKWSVFNASATGGRTGQGIHIGTNQRTTLFFPAGHAAHHATWIFGFAHLVNAGGSLGFFPLLQLGNGTIFGGGQWLTERIVTVDYSEATRVLRFIFQNDTIEAVRTSPLDIGVWNYFEVKIVVADVGGLIEAHMNGGLLGSFSGDTKISSSTLGAINFPAYEVSQQSHRFDDLYLLNGDAPNNNFLGDTRIYSLVPNNNGFYSQLTGSDGDQINNYLLVDEEPTPNTADYTGSSVAGEKDTYNLEDIPDTAPNVAGVVVRSYAAKSTTGLRRFRPTLRIASVDYPGTDQTLSTGFATFSQFYDQSPAGGNWTKAIVDAMEAGFEVRT